MWIEDLVDTIKIKMKWQVPEASLTVAEEGWGFPVIINVYKWRIFTSEEFSPEGRAWESWSLFNLECIYTNSGRTPGDFPLASMSWAWILAWNLIPGYRALLRTWPGASVPSDIPKPLSTSLTEKSGYIASRWCLPVPRLLLFHFTVWFPFEVLLSVTLYLTSKAGGFFHSSSHS